MEIIDSSDSSTTSEYPDASTGSMTIASVQADIFDTSYDAIDKFLREWSPVELLEEMNMFELTSDSGANSNHDDTSVYDLNEQDDDILQVCAKKTRAKMYRCSRKEEIETLRKTVSCLKAQFQSLEIKKARNNSGMMISPRTQKLWRQVALSQLDRRRISESENASLREMVRIQILEAKNLRRILKRRSRIEEALGLKGIKTLLKNTLTDNQHIFEKLLHEADLLFVGMDDLFATKGMDNLPFTGHMRDTNLDIVDGVYYEMLQKRMLPFDIHATGKAVWECLHRLGMDNLRGVGGSNGPVNVHPNATEEEGDTLRSSFFAVMSGIGDLVGTFNSKIARWYKGEDKTAFVCRVISEPKFESRRQKISATTTMQIVLNKVDTGDEDNDATTVMKVYFSAERPALAAKEDPATPMAFAAWDKLVPRFPIDVESVLLDAESNTFKLAESDLV